MPHRIELKPAAARDLKNIPKNDLIRIARKIDSLAEDPRHQGARKMSGSQDIWRIRAGDYRVLYQIRDDRSLVMIARIRHRKEVYRNL